MTKRTGWRIWKVDNCRLVSPFANTTLSGHTIIADCELRRLPFEGISFWPDLADALTAIEIIGEPLAVTKGEATGPILRDLADPLYSIEELLGSRTRVLPDGLRCRAYRVTHVCSVQPVTASGFEVLPLAFGAQ
jgi:hypothetical protein